MAKQNKHANIDDAISDSEYVLAKYKFIKNLYPDITLNGYYNGFVSKDPHFLSKTINDTYTKFSFDIRWSSARNKDKILVAYRFSEIEFDYNGKKEIIKVYASPRNKTVASIERPDTFAIPKIGNGTVQKKVKFEKTIVFTPFIKNLAESKYDEKLLKECQAIAINFIQNHSDCKIDKTNLDARISKLLLFT
jgi:hypothetical protein